MPRKGRKRGAQVSVLEMEMAGFYTPRTKETREAYEALLGTIHGLFGDQPQVPCLFTPSYGPPTSSPFLCPISLFSLPFLVLLLLLFIPLFAGHSARSSRRGPRLAQERKDNGAQTCKFRMMVWEDQYEPSGS